MFTANQCRLSAKQYRAKAAESAEALKHTALPSEIRELRRSTNSFNSLANNAEWLADNLKNIIHSHDVQDADARDVGTLLASKGSNA
jgi:hypothetical protein